MRPVAAFVIALALVSPTSPAHAINVVSGEVVLPMSGLVVDLPASNDGTYVVTGAYRLGEGRSYHSVDTIELWDDLGDMDEWGLGDWLERYEVRHGALTGDCRSFLEGEKRSHFEILSLSMFGVAGTVMTELSPRRITFCATLGGESLIVAMRLLTSADTHEQLRVEASRATLPERIVRAFKDVRVRVEPPRGRKDVTGRTGSRPYPAPFRLGRLAIDLVPPDDGFVWIHDGKLAERSAGDFIATMFPSAVDLGIELGQLGRGACDGAWNRLSGTRAGPATVGTWSGERVTQQDGRFHEAWLCRSEPDRVLLARLTAKAPLGDLDRFAPILDAIAAALKKLPAPPARTSSSQPTPHSGHSGPSGGNTTDGFFFGQLGSEVIFSHRDTQGRSADSHPPNRFIGPGLAMDFALLINGFMGRLALAATVDWVGLFGSNATGAARWGAEHYEAALEVGFGLGTDFVFGLTAGWTGLSGPLTLNSSLSLSAILGMPPANPGDSGWFLRATPVQLFASNERELFSPLAIELFFSPGSGPAFGPGFGFGLGFQWIGPPEPGDEDIPAEGWALSFKFGTALFIRAR